MSHMIFALQYFKIVFFFFLIYIFIYLLSSGFYWDRSTGKDLSSFWNSNTIPMVWHDLSPRVHGVLLHTCSTTTYHFPYGKRRRFGSSIQNVHLRPTPTYHHTASFGPQVMYIVFKKKLIWQKRPFHLSDIVQFLFGQVFLVFSITNWDREASDSSFERRRPRTKGIWAKQPTRKQPRRAITSWKNEESDGSWGIIPEGLRLW